MIDLGGVKMIDRPRMFRSAFTRAIEELRANPNIFHRSPKASGKSYCGGVTRKRVRTVARQMAREQMRKIREPKK